MAPAARIASLWTELKLAGTVITACQFTRHQHKSDLITAVPGCLWLYNTVEDTVVAACEITLQQKVTSPRGAPMGAPMQT